MMKLIAKLEEVRSDVILEIKTSQEDMVAKLNENHEAIVGVLVDFIRKLRQNPAELEILGSGRQKKSYLEVKDCVQAMLLCLDGSDEPVNVFNIGSEDSIDVTEIADIVVSQMGLRDVRYRYTGGEEGRGWKGDVRAMLLSLDKIKSLGWRPKWGSSQAIRSAVQALLRDKSA